MNKPYYAIKNVTANEYWSPIAGDFVMDFSPDCLVEDYDWVEEKLGDLRAWHWEELTIVEFRVISVEQIDSAENIQ